MARNFVAGSFTYIQVNAGQLASNAFTYGSCAVIVRRTTTTANFYGLLNLGAAATSANFDFEFDTTGHLYASMDGGTTFADTGANTFTSTTGWFCYGFSKATGSAAPVFHIYDYTAGTWQHITGGTALADGATATDTIVTIGAYNNSGDYFDGDIAAAGAWRTLVPASNADWEALGLPFSRMAWVGAAARADKSFVAFLDQDATATPVRDVIGGGQQSAISATVPTVSTVSVPNFGWGAPVLMPNRSAAAVTYSPNISNYRYKTAMQRAATW